MAVFLPSRYRQLPDIGYDETERQLLELIAEIESVYGQAYTELNKKANQYLAWFVQEDNKMKQKYMNGEVTKKQYQNWRQRKLLSGIHWQAMTETMSTNFTNANLIAYSIINDYIPQMYAINGNWAVYEVEHALKINTSFELINEMAIERLIKQKPDLLPRVSLNVAADERWNKQNMTSAVMQSILQGESIPQLAKRIASISDINEKSSIKIARTITTSAQNGARQDMFKRNESFGIKGKKLWLSTLDFRTRDSHRELDGTSIDIHGKFSNGLEFPGDPSGEPSEVYNCRCKITEIFEDQDFSKFERNSKLGDMSYEEWKAAHGNEPEFRAARNVERDKNMWKEYKDLLKKQVPAKFQDFQKLKYENPEEWKKMISDARKARKKRRESDDNK